jgi:hypothetical protein
VPPEKANCLAFVGDRKSGVCFASKQNNEEREASFSYDGKKRLVEDAPTEGTTVKVKTKQQAWFLLLESQPLGFRAIISAISNS